MDLLHEELMEPKMGTLGQDASEDEDEEEEGNGSRKGLGLSPPVGSSGAASPMGSDAEPEEYETADSGVSEQSSNDGNEEEEERGKVERTGEEEVEEQEEASKGKKRRRWSRGRESLGGDGIEERMAETFVRTTTLLFYFFIFNCVSGGGDSGSSSKRDRDGESGLGSQVSALSSSDVELEFADALSSASGSPPLSSSPRPILPGAAQRSPTKARECSYPTNIDSVRKHI